MNSLRLPPETTAPESTPVQAEQAREVPEQCTQIRFGLARTRVSRVLPAKWRPVPYPGLVPHHGGAGWLVGHSRTFQEATRERGEDASTYFERSGITSLARTNDGLCTFWLGSRLALYQATNEPLVSDDDLGPSIDINASLFGNFVGALPNRHPLRGPKRAVIERTLGSARFVTALEPQLRTQIRKRLQHAERRTLQIDSFSLDLIAHVESIVPGVLDLRIRPLSDYLASPEHGAIALAFFEIASKALSTVNPRVIADADLIVDFTRAVLEDNFDAIADAPPTNLLRSHLKVLGLPFSRLAVAGLGREVLKELGTIIVAAYDTTALSLTWTLALLSQAPSVTADFAQRCTEGEGADALAERIVLEAVRLGGSNPTALWRRVMRPTRVQVGRGEIELQPGTMLWLDRYAANRDPRRFPNPEHFDLANIDSLTRVGGDPYAALIARRRYEINSFSMVNTFRNPRKCPGRIFSVAVQAMVLTEMFTTYTVSLRDADTKFAPHSAMPRPRSAGTLSLQPLAHSARDPRACTRANCDCDRRSI